jgi:protein-disulfide isomerase
MTRQSMILVAACVGAFVFTACQSQPPPSGSSGQGAPEPKPAAPAADKPAAPAPAPAAAPAAAAPDKGQVATLIKRYYGASGEIPPDVDMVVTELKPSDIGGLYAGKLRLSRGEQSQELGFLLSPDGRWYLQAEAVDLTVDPVAAVVDKIKITEDDPSLGPKDAVVKIVEYSDFQCPFCARADKIVKEEVLKEYGDRVTFVYKQFPLASIHPWAEPASILGLCVRKQKGNDAYWKYHEAVFAAQQEVTAENAKEKLLDLAVKAGANRDAAKACLDAGETKAIVAATIAEAELLGIDSTPTFFINGRKLAGAQPLSAFKAIIDPELAKGKQG